MQMTSANQHARILLAEDNIPDQRLFERAIRKSEYNIDLDIVADGEEALAYLLRKDDPVDDSSNRSPDLIMLDINMPRVNGKQVLSAIKQDPELKCIPVVVYTTSDQTSDIVDCYKLGANCYVTKPSRLNDTFNTISKIAEFWLSVVALA